MDTLVTSAKDKRGVLWAVLLESPWGQLKQAEADPGGGMATTPRHNRAFRSQGPEDRGGGPRGKA